MLQIASCRRFLHVERLKKRFIIQELFNIRLSQYSMHLRLAPDFNEQHISVV